MNYIRILNLRLTSKTKLAQKGDHQTKIPEVLGSILTEGNIFYRMQQ